MASRPSKVRIGSHWTKPPTRIYDYNYNVQEGYYKPQMDYLNKREKGVVEEPPKAKTFAERLAYQYPGSNKVYDGSGSGGQVLPRSNHPFRREPDLDYGSKDRHSDSRPPTSPTESLREGDLFGRKNKADTAMKNLKAEMDSLLSDKEGVLSNNRSPSRDKPSLQSFNRSMSNDPFFQDSKDFFGPSKAQGALSKFNLPDI